MSFTYDRVDDGPDPALAREWQVRLDQWPAVRAYKEHSYRELRDADLVLDVGCGPGVDVARLAPRRVVGLDPSAVMCEAAASRTSRVVRGDAHALPFAAERFEGVRADRVLQHIADPLAALREMRRVVCPGGRLVLADPDQESLTIHVPGVPERLTDRVKALRRDVGYRNGRLASRLPAVLVGAGLVEVDVQAFPVVITDPTHAFGLPTWPRSWRSRA